MAKINSNYQKLQTSYLFSEIAKRVRAFADKNPTAPIIRLGIGDVVLPLPPPIVDALKAAADEMGRRDSFQGYGPEQGHGFLREAIAAHYASQGAQVAADEVFVSDGSKCDSGNMQEIFAIDNVVAVTDPVYPVYVDTNVMAGRTEAPDASGRYGRLVYLPTTAENGFDPALPDQKVDLIYLCSPNNPTGAVLSRASLGRWIKYAREQEAIILFDAAYEAFIREPGQVHSIYELPGARDVAIEFRSLSKTAGFTGTRCAYTVIPKEVSARNDKGEPVALHGLWNRRHTTKFNGVSYPIQKAALAGLPAGGPGRRRGQHRLLHGQRAHHPRGPGQGRLLRPRRGQRALHLGARAVRPDLLGLLRQAAEPGQRGRHPRLRLRQLRRGLLPDVRLRPAGKRRGGHPPHPDAVDGVNG